MIIICRLINAIYFPYAVQSVHSAWCVVLNEINLGERRQNGCEIERIPHRMQTHRVWTTAIECHLVTIETMRNWMAVPEMVCVHNFQSLNESASNWKITNFCVITFAQSIEQYTHSTHSRSYPIFAILLLRCVGDSFSLLSLSSCFTEFVRFLLCSLCGSVAFETPWMRIIVIDKVFTAAKPNRHARKKKKM